MKPLAFIAHLSFDMKFKGIMEYLQGYYNKVELKTEDKIKDS